MIPITNFTFNVNNVNMLPFIQEDGLPVWANLLLAVTEEVEGAMQGELTAREKRIARYTAKYKK